MKESNRLHLRIIAPGRFVLDEEVDEVLLPGIDGQIGILPGHRPLILGLGRGDLFYRRGEKQNQLSLSSGYATISAREVVVIAESFEIKEEASFKDRICGQAAKSAISNEK